MEADPCLGAKTIATTTIPRCPVRGTALHLAACVRHEMRLSLRHGTHGGTTAMLCPRAGEACLPWSHEPWPITRSHSVLAGAGSMTDATLRPPELRYRGKPPRAHKRFCYSTATTDHRDLRPDHCNLDRAPSNEVKQTCVLPWYCSL